MSAPSKSRRVLYCLVPFELADELHDELREHFRDCADVQVVIEFRGAERRRAERRVEGEEGPLAKERRRIRNLAGRRIADRRAVTVPVAAPELPPLAVRHIDRLSFIERIEPATQQAEDVDSARLVVAAQAGDGASFTTLYMRYFDRLYSYLRLAVKDAHDAEDITQDVFVQMLRLLPDYEVRSSHPFRVLLFRIARNRSIDHFRKHRSIDVESPEAVDRMREQVLLDDPSGSFDNLSDSELAAYLKRLPATQRQVLILRYVLDFSTEEIAEVMTVTPQAVRNMQHRALRFLRSQLGDGDEEQSARTYSPMVMRVRGGTVVRERRSALASHRVGARA